MVRPTGTADTLLVASGSGRALSIALGALIDATSEAQGRTVRTVDVAPVSPQDFNGLSSF